MSSVHNYPTLMEDRECVIEAVKQLGYKPTVLNPGQSQRLRLWGKGNGFLKETAEIIIPKEQISEYSNDVGFRREGTQFRLIAAAYEGGRELGPAWVIKMKQAYSEQVLMKMYRARGYTQFERREIQTDNGIAVSILAQTPQHEVPVSQELGYR